MQEKTGNKAGKLFFWPLLIVLGLSASLLSVEVATYALHKFGKIQLADRDSLVAMAKDVPEGPSGQKPIYIPHPYFGYIYTPNNSFIQKTQMQSNSDGFIDEEFPSERKEGLCIYGILGGSAAMSWGVEKREERISYQLEVLLNTYAKNNTCKEYRVLNMGIGSHLQYQATQIYLYYQDLLDGVIFYNGSNECSHASIFATDDPAEYPEINIYTLMQMDSPLKYEISSLRQKMHNSSAFLQKRQYLLYSPLARYLSSLYFTNKLEQIDELNNRISTDSHSAVTGLPSIKGKHENARRIFQEIKPQDFWYSDVPDSQKKLIRTILPVVYTDPTINAFAVARTRNTHFLSIVQPMSGILNKRPHEQVPMYQKIGNQILTEEADKLAAYGIKTYNLNNIALFDQAGNDMFTDDTHINAAGNKIVARYIFELVQNEWHTQDND